MPGGDHIDDNDDRRLLGETTARFLDKYASVRWVRDHIDDLTAFDSDGWRRGAELGWAAMLVPEQHGGGSVSGHGVLDAAEIAEQLGRVLHPAPFLSTNVVAAAISRSGSNELRQDLLPSIAAGELTAAWCHTEASGSIDDAGISLEIRRVADGVQLDGAKRFVLDGHCASAFLVTGRDPAGGLTQAVVRRDAPGVSVQPMACTDFSRRVAEVRFDRSVVAESALVGQPGAADADVARQLALAVVLQCADSVGAMGSVNDMTFDYARERFAFGRAIGSFQAIKHRCVEMYLGAIGARAITAAAAEAAQQESPEAATFASLAKAYVGDAFSRNVEHAHQIHGGISYTWEHDVHLYSRHAKFNEAMFGSPGWHRDRLGAELGI